MLWTSAGATTLAGAHRSRIAWATGAVAGVAFVATLCWGDRRLGFQRRRYRDMAAATGWPYVPTLAVMAACYAAFLAGWVAWIASLS